MARRWNVGLHSCPQRWPAFFRKVGWYRSPKQGPKIPIPIWVPGTSGWVISLKWWVSPKSPPQNWSFLVGKPKSYWVITTILGNPQIYTYIHLVIQSDLFGMVKTWPFGKAKWPPTSGWKGHGLNHLASEFSQPNVSLSESPLWSTGRKHASPGPPGFSRDPTPRCPPWLFSGIPSRERSHIPPWEKEDHLQNWFFPQIS